MYGMTVQTRMSSSFPVRNLVPLVLTKSGVCGWKDLGTHPRSRLSLVIKSSPIHSSRRDSRAAIPSTQNPTTRSPEGRKLVNSLSILILFQQPKRPSHDIRNVGGNIGADRVLDENPGSLTCILKTGELNVDNGVIRRSDAFFFGFTKTRISDGHDYGVVTFLSPLSSNCMPRPSLSPSS